MVAGGDTSLQLLSDLIIANLAQGRKLAHASLGVWMLEDVSQLAPRLELPDELDKKTLQLDTLQFMECLSSVKAPTQVERVVTAAKLLMGPGARYDGWEAMAHDVVQHEKDGGTLEGGMPAVEVLKIAAPQALQAVVIPSLKMATMTPGPFFSVWTDLFLIKLLNEPPPPQLAEHPDVHRRACTTAVSWLCHNLEIVQESGETVGEMAIRVVATCFHVGCGIVALCESMSKGSTKEALSELDKIAMTSALQETQEQTPVDKPVD